MRFQDMATALAAAALVVSAGTLSRAQAPAQTPAPAGTPAAGTVQGTPAQDTAKGASLMAEARKALGGEDKFKTVQRLEVKGKSARAQAQTNLEGDFELLFEIPDKYLRKESISLGNAGIDITQILNGTEVSEVATMGQTGGAIGGFDGGDGGGGNRGGRAGNLAGLLGGSVVTAAGNDPESQKEAQHKSISSDMARMRAALLLSITEPVAWVGVAESPDGKADVLEFKTPDGVVTRFLLDATSHMPLLMSWVGIAPQGGNLNRGGGNRGGGGNARRSVRCAAGPPRRRWFCRSAGDTADAPLRLQDGQWNQAAAPDSARPEWRDDRRVSREELQDQSFLQGGHLYKMTRSTFALVALLVAAPAFAQTPAPARPATPAPNAAAQNANQAQLRLIVIDQTSAGIPTATVTLTPSEGEPVTVITDERGVVTVPSLPAGTFKIHIEFSGFDTYEGTLNLRRGANNQTVTMALAGLTQEVVVNSDEQAGGDTRGAAMTTTLTKEEIAALPDTQEDLQTFLEELAGPGGATFFLNGFRGGRLPTKDEIRTIRIRSNSFAADGHDSGGRTGIEIITRPSTGSYQGGMTFGYQGDKLSARNPQAMEETPEGTKQIQLQFRGPIIRNKTSFSLNVSGNNQYRSIAQIALDQSGNPLGTQVRVPTETRNVSGNIEHALTAGSTLRLAYQGTQSEGSNQGLTNFDYTERARQTESTGNMYRAQVQGLVGQGMLNEIRFEFNRRRNETTSYSNAPAVIVPDAFSSGGAGVFTRNLNQTFEIADNFDFTPIKNHQMRVGLLIEGGLYDFFDETNPNGRTNYASFNDFQIDRKLQFTQRFGLVENSFNQYQAGFYVQDDIKVNNRLSLGIGLRNEMQTRIDDRINLMPRIGFSLNPGGTRTSIRGGYGKYYDWYEASLHDQTLRLDGKAQVDLLTIFDTNWTSPGDPSSTRTAKRSWWMPTRDRRVLARATAQWQHRVSSCLTCTSFRSAWIASCGRA